MSAEVAGDVATIDCADLSTREINRTLRRLADREVPEVVLLNPAARHNLGVALLGPIRLRFRGSAGYYCAGMIDGPDVRIEGNCGWAVGEDMLSGRIEVRGNAGPSAGAAIRGGTIVIHGDAGARVGISMKGGLIVVRGSVGYLTGFMMQKGTIVIGGDAGDALGDSMYEGRIFIAGRAAGLGNDAVEKDPTADDLACLAEICAAHDLGRRPADFRKIESGRRLWNFSTKEIGLWREAL